MRTCSIRSRFTRGVQVRRTVEEPLFNSLMEQYHYLGYEQPVGEHVKHLVKAPASQGSQVIACLVWASAPRHLKLRDRYLGWSDEARERNVHLLAYNTRFLILPWVRVPHLASHILGCMVARPLAGGEEKRILDKVAQRGFAVFEDGIYYLSPGAAEYEIQFYEFATGRSQLVSSLLGQLDVYLSVSPDRKIRKILSAGTQIRV